MNKKEFVRTLCQFPLPQRRRFLRQVLQRLFPRNFSADVVGNVPPPPPEYSDWDFNLDRKLADTNPADVPPPTETLPPVPSPGDVKASMLSPASSWKTFEPETPEHTTNFVIRFGREPQRLLVGCHYDIVPTTPGANDNAAAVSQILDAALIILRKYGAGPQAPNVTFVFFDYEEAMGADYMGSKTYVRQYAKTLPELAAILDVTGVGEIYYSRGQTTKPAAEKYLPGMPSRRTPPSDTIAFSGKTDHILFCALPPEEMDQKKHPYPQTWHNLHQPGDIPDLIEDAALDAGTQAVLDLIRKFNGLQERRRR